MTEAKNKPRERAQGTRVITIAGFPEVQWLDWEMDCKENFGDCRWLKMWNDHLRAKDYQHYQYVLRKIKEMEDQLYELNAKLNSRQQEPEQQGVKTFAAVLK